MLPSPPHQPVLLEEAVSYLVTDPDGIYLDGTIGFGGHAEALLSKLSKKGQLIGIDLDPYALDYTQKRLSAHFTSYSLHHGNFREYPILLQKEGVSTLTGILIDLGTSSCQIDSVHRGFSFQQDAPLDMRFNSQSGMTAGDFLNSSTEENISDVIKKYGEERRHRKIAGKISRMVKGGKMNTTFDLKEAVSGSVHPRHVTKSLARVFQAIRIHINHELDSLKSALQSSLGWVKAGGRIAIISFHSLEDRIVKQFFKEAALTCVCPKEFPVCVCDTTPELKILTSRGIKASAEEVKHNSRSRSAKLRVAERI
jgi:16S rRNA (cytosine1402-N4)-methyltransferase